MQSCDTISEISDILKCNFNENSGNGETKISMDVDQPSYSEDENELTESKIKSFLDEKVTHAQCYVSSVQLYSTQSLQTIDLVVKYRNYRLQI